MQRSPEQRFDNHKKGIKAAGVVRRFGERLVSRLYAHLNPMPFARAQEMETMLAESLRKRGYVVFAVLHSSQPKYSVPEIVEDMHRAVRFIKASAKKYDVNPDKLGIEIRRPVSR